MNVSKYNVLIVEDEQRLCGLIRRGLERISTMYDIMTVNSAQEAIKALGENPFDVMVTDIRMPGVTGIDLLKHTRTSYPELQSIVITGHGDLENAIEALSLGASNYIKKPISFEVLHFSIQKCMEKVALQNQLQESEERFRQSFMSAAAGMIILKPGGEIQQANQSFCHMIGMEETIIAGRKIQELLHPESLEYCLSVMNQVAEGKTSQVHFESRFLSIDDHIIWTNVSASRISEKIQSDSYLTMQILDITEKKNAEIAVEKLRRQNELILNTAGEGIFGINLQGKFTFINPAAAGMLGLEIESAINSDSNPYWIHPKRDKNRYPDGEYPIMAAWKLNKTIRRDDELFQTSDGSMIPVEYVVTPMVEMDDVVGSVVVFKDITERKKSRDALEQVAKELAQLINTANAPIFGIDTQGAVNEWNQMARQILGYSKSEVLGKDLVRDFIAEENQDQVEKIFNRALKGIETVNFELPLVRKDGKRVTVILNASTRRAVDGTVTGVIGVGQDITELIEYRKDLEKKVDERTGELNIALSDAEHARDYIDGILKSMADGLIVTDMYYNVVLMNRAAEDFLNVRLSDVINRPVDFAFSELTLRERIKETLSKHESGGQFDFDIRKSGAKSPQILRARTSTIRGRDGHATGIIAIFHDVSHEREVDRMKSEFISTAAHELRTPITSIQGFQKYC